MTPKDQWTWMPHPAHFICARDCKFFLATEVGGYIVSTVGEYLPDSRVREIFAKCRMVKVDGMGDAWDRDYMDKIGYEALSLPDWLYETMVFPSVDMPETECKGCLFKIESGNNLDGDMYKTPEDAFKGHMALCEKWAAIPPGMTREQLDSDNP